MVAGLGLLWLGVWMVALVPGRAALLFFPLLSFGYYLAQTLLEVMLHGQLANRHRFSHHFHHPGREPLASCTSARFYIP